MQIDPVISLDVFVPTVQDGRVGGRYDGHDERPRQPRVASQSYRLIGAVLHKQHSSTGGASRTFPPGALNLCAARIWLASFRAPHSRVPRVHPHAESGHYIAIVREGDAWYEFDDETVSRREPPAANDKLIARHATQLFYEAIKEEEHPPPQKRGAADVQPPPGSGAGQAGAPSPAKRLKKLEAPNRRRRR